MTDAVIVHNAGGRNRAIGKKGLALLEQMAADGNSQTSMAKTLRMDRSTLTEIKKRQPEVEEAIERGYSQMEDELVGGLMTRVRRGILDPKDKGAITAAIFLLKTRRGYEGTKVPHHIVINQDNRTQTIALPSAMDMDAYMRRVADGTPVSVPS
jgi:hypothetical protein